MNVTALIPAYQPDEKLITTLRGLKEVGFTDLLVVDDGSRESCAPIFAEAEQIDGCTVLHHPVNRGKGAALKTAFAYLLEKNPDGIPVVTGDADGQHLPKDMKAAAERMMETGKIILGCRDFDEPHVPPRSRFGNHFTSGVFDFFFHTKLSDTQTGLRAFPASSLRAMLEIPGDRYEYETGMLFEMVKYGWPFEEVTIETVYLDDNKSSHFRVIRDSARIYEMPLKFSLGSLAATALDAVFFAVLLALLKPILPAVTAVLVSGVGARFLSGILNFTYNRTVTFPGIGERGSFGRYALLWWPEMLLSSAFAGGLAALFPAIGTGWLILIRIVLSAILFSTNFRVEHNRVFR